MHLYIGTSSHVAAIDVKTGQEVWRTKLPKASYYAVCILDVDGRVFAGSGGYVHALDAQTGKLLWTNKLKGLGFQPVTLATGGRSVQLIAQPKSPIVTMPT
jgi:outer membrane protein assembly factor BamB